MADAIPLRDFERRDQGRVRRLILDGLGEHWSAIDEPLNTDLDDIAASYVGRARFTRHDGPGTDHLALHLSDDGPSAWLDRDRVSHDARPSLVVDSGTAGNRPGRLSRGARRPTRAPAGPHDGSGGSA